MIRPLHLAVVLTVCVVSLLLVDAALVYYHYQVEQLPWLLVSMFNVDSENNLPTWFSSMQLLGAALLLYGNYVVARSCAEPGAIAWLGLAVVFLGLSADEVAGLHETLNHLTRGEWTTYGMGFVAVVALLWGPWFWRLPWSMQLQCSAAAALFLGGAIGMERYSAWYAQFNLLDSVEYRRETIVEEALEMFGVTLFIYAIAAHLERRMTP